MRKKQLNMIDLFAGAGGLSTGLSDAGFTSIFASEIVETYAKTYKKNHPSAEVLTEDIRNVNPDSVREHLGLAVGSLDLIVGGPP